MSFFNRFRGSSEKPKGSKKTWEPPKIPPDGSDEDLEQECSMETKNQDRSKPSSFNFIQNDNSISHQDSAPKSNFSFLTEDETKTSNIDSGVESMSSFSFISKPIASELKDKEKQAVLSREETSSNEERNNRKESTSSFGSGSAFGFISDDQVPKDITHEPENTSEQNISSDEIKQLSNDLPLESQFTQKGAEQTPVAREQPSVGRDMKAEKGELDIIVSNDKTDEVSDDTCYDESKIGGENEAGGDPDSQANRSDLEIRSQTLEDLKGIIGQNLEDVSYDVSLNEDEKFELYVETLKSREKSLRKGLDELKQRRDDVLSHLKETTFSKDFLSSQLKQLKIKQNNAISKEDFELADKINQEIETRQAELRNLKYQHPILDQMVSSFVEDCNATIGNHLEECISLEKEFHEIIVSEKENIEKKISKNEVDINKEKLKLDKEKSQLDREMSHIALDKEQWEKSKLKFDEEVIERTRDQQSEKSRLLVEKQVIETEINELEAKLLSLREKESSIISKVDIIDLKIQEMTVDFQPQEESLEKELRDIAEKENEVASKLKLLEETEAKLTARKEAEEQLQQKCMDNIETLTVKISSLEKLKKEMDQNLINLQEVVDVDLLNFLPSKEHASLIEKVKELSIQLQDAEYKDIDCGAQITRIKKRLDDIEARVEELEKEKQMAISGRNYKAAKIVTEERNKIMEEGQMKQEELKDLEDAQACVKSSITRLSTDIEAAKKDALQIEFEIDKKIHSSLAEAVTSLRSYYNNSTLDAWIRPFVGFEIEICQGIIKEICSKHNWEDPEVLKYDHAIVEDEINSEPVCCLSC